MESSPASETSTETLHSKLPFSAPLPAWKASLLAVKGSRNPSVWPAKPGAQLRPGNRAGNTLTCPFEGRDFRFTDVAGKTALIAESKYWYPKAISFARAQYNPCRCQNRRCRRSSYRPDLSFEGRDFSLTDIAGKTDLVARLKVRLKPGTQSSVPSRQATMGGLSWSSGQ